MRFRFWRPTTSKPREEITIGDYDEGDIIDVEMHDGSFIRLRKLDNDHDPRNRRQAMDVLERSMREQIFSTGLIYYEEPRPDAGGHGGTGRDAAGAPGSCRFASIRGCA